jgi:hypothetical protein
MKRMKNFYHYERGGGMREDGGGETSIINFYNNYYINNDIFKSPDANSSGRIKNNIIVMKLVSGYLFRKCF